jgi:hypothetical protein
LSSQEKREFVLLLHCIPATHQGFRSSPSAKPRNHGKLKIQWIIENAALNVTFWKRRAVLLEKAKELSILCKIPVATAV